MDLSMVPLSSPTENFILYHSAQLISHQSGPRRPRGLCSSPVVTSALHFPAATPHRIGRDKVTASLYCTVCLLFSWEKAQNARAHEER